MRILSTTVQEIPYFVKNHLPEEIKKRFLTKKQWLEKGFTPKENAKPLLMHPS